MPRFVRLTRIDHHDQGRAVWLNADTIARVEPSGEQHTRLVLTDFLTALTVSERPDQVLAFLTDQPLPGGSDCELCGRASFRGALHAACVAYEQALADAPKERW